MTSWPCQHHLSMDGKKLGILDGMSIARIYADNGQEIPNHFKQYAPTDPKKPVTAVVSSLDKDKTTNL